MCRGPIEGGTALTRALATRHAKPLLVVDLLAPPDVAAVRAWIEANAVGVLNVAGPRETQRPGIGTQARAFLAGVL